MVVNVLVMDDANVVRERIVEMLSEFQIGEILEADTTQTAASLIEKHQPRVAILDIQVPGTTELRNGIDVLKWIRNRYPSTAVIMISNFDIPRYRDTCNASGAAHFFDKSSEFEQLPYAVKHLLGI